jgi:glutaredoxin 3
VAVRELFGSSQCEHTRDMREWLEWSRVDFVEYDVEHDREALHRLTTLTGNGVVPVLVEDGAVIQVGWRGRGCTVVRT